MSFVDERLGGLPGVRETMKHGTQPAVKWLNDTLNVLPALVAFVALDIRRVVFRHIATVNNKVTRIHKDEFYEGCEAKTWKEATSGSD